MKVFIKRSEKSPITHQGFSSTEEVVANIDVEGRNVLFEIGDNCYFIPLALIKVLEEESKSKELLKGLG